ncbi:MAG: hypothetical protein PVI86_09680 [Phycisphaerae bacterium]|jgi:hypothetical protein
MKVILVILVLLGLAYGGLVFFGGYATFDPNEQGRQAREAVKEGMTWVEVVDAVKEPKKYSYFIRTTENLGGEEIELFKPSIPIRFNRESFTRRFDEGGFPHGFQFRYVFSQSVAFAVNMDKDGVVEYVEDLRTMADLLQYKND